MLFVRVVCYIRWLMNYDDLYLIWGIYFECSLNNDLNKVWLKNEF